MGFPAFEKLEPFYRNSLPAVIQFFKEKHKNKVKVSLGFDFRFIISVVSLIAFIILIFSKDCLWLAFPCLTIIPAHLSKSCSAQNYA